MALTTTRRSNPLLRGTNKKSYISGRCEARRTCEAAGRIRSGVRPRFSNKWFTSAFAGSLPAVVGLICCMRPSRLIQAVCWTHSLRYRARMLSRMLRTSALGKLKSLLPPSVHVVPTSAESSSSHTRSCGVKRRVSRVRVHGARRAGGSSVRRVSAFVAEGLEPRTSPLHGPK